MNERHDHNCHCTEIEIEPIGERVRVRLPKIPDPNGGMRQDILYFQTDTAMWFANELKRCAIEAGGREG